MNARELAPLAFAAAGVVLDALTTVVGLSLGFYETHPNYNPAFALMLFWSLIAVVRLLPRTKVTKMTMAFLSVAPFLGAVNNSLVIMGVFQGLAI